MIKVLKRIFRKYKLLPPSWEDIERFNVAWKTRTAEMAALLPPDCASILDLGCGKMWLKAFLEQDTLYIPVDYKARDETTVICDFNKYQFPSQHAQVCFVSGVLEYMMDLEWFVGKVTSCASLCLISYCTLELYPNKSKRKQLAWKNHRRKSEIINLFATNGATLRKTKVVNQNTIFLFETNVPTENIDH